VTQVVQGGRSSTTALHGSTEDEQFFDTTEQIKAVA
jgi:isocitrate lyase